MPLHPVPIGTDSVPMNENSKFCKLLKRTRASKAKASPRQWTLRACAKRGGIKSAANLMRWERGALPRSPYLPLIARAYDLPLADLRTAWDSSA